MYVSHIMFHASKNKVQGWEWLVTKNLKPW
jgi:hypothetical protein